MRIAQLKLRNIGPIEEQTFDFQRSENLDVAEIHILTGPNGSGKSTILYALASIFSRTPAKTDIRTRLYRDDCKISISLENPTAEVTLEGDGNGGLSAQSGYAQKIQEYVNFISGNRHMQVQSTELDFAVFGYSGMRSLVQTQIQSIQELTIHPLQNVLDFQRPVDSAQLLQWIANTKAKIAFANQDGLQEQADNYEASVGRIESAVSKIIDKKVRFSFEYEPLSVGIEIDGQQLQFDMLPDGLKSIISWIADLLMRLERLKWVDSIPVLDRSFILLLDEIEIHLHPAWQRKILPVVQELFSNAQIFAVTHSPFVVGSIDDALVYKLAVENGKSHLASVEEAMAGSSYPTVLDEIFGIDEYFDVDTEEDFEKFYDLKQSILSGNDTTIDELLQISRKLLDKTVETRDIVGRELRQIQRITGKEITL